MFKRILAFIVAIGLIALPASADVKISGLPSVTVPAGADLVPIVHSGTTSQASLTNIFGNAPAITSSGAISGTTGAFSSTVTATSGFLTGSSTYGPTSATVNGGISGTTGTFTAPSAALILGTSGNQGSNVKLFNAGGYADIFSNTASSVNGVATSVMGLDNGAANLFAFSSLGDIGMTGGVNAANGYFKNSSGGSVVIGTASAATTQAIKIFNAAAFVDISSNASGGAIAGVAPSALQFDYNNTTNLVSISSTGDVGAAGVVRGAAHNSACNVGLPCSGQTSCTVSSGTSCTATVTVVSGAICTDAIDNASSFGYTLYLPPNVAVSGTTLTVYGRLNTASTGTIYLDYTCD